MKITQKKSDRYQLAIKKRKKKNKMKLYKYKVVIFINDKLEGWNEIVKETKFL